LTSINKTIDKTEIETYKNLSAMLSLKTVAENEIIFNEGDSGDLFYIVLDGEVEVLKSTKVPVEFETHNDEDQALLLKRQAFLSAFQKNYNMLFWPGMTIAKKLFDEMFGFKSSVTSPVNSDQHKKLRNERVFDDFV
jgi:hypothetical protein